MANLEWAPRLATRLIKKYGVDVDVTFFLPGIKEKPYDDPPPIKREFKKVKGLFRSYEQDLIDGVIFKVEDREVAIAGPSLKGEDFTRRLNAHITLGNQTWQVQDIETISPDGNDIVYFFHVRK